MDGYITLKEASELTGKAVKTLRKIIPKLDIKRELVNNSATVFLSIESLNKFYPVPLPKKKSTPTPIKHEKERAPLPVENKKKEHPYSKQSDLLIESLTERIKSLEEQNNRLWSKLDEQEKTHKETIQNLIKSTDEQIKALIKSKEHSDILLRELTQQKRLESKEQKKKRSLIEILFYK